MPKAQNDQSKREKLAAVMDELNKKYEDSFTSFQDDEHAINVEAIPTGCLSLDHVFGCGGLPRGRVVEIYGSESCQPAGSKVLMAEGVFKNIEEVEVGDTVVSPQQDGTNVFSKVVRTTSWDCPEVVDIVEVFGGKKRPLYSCSYNHIVPFFESVSSKSKGKSAYRNHLSQWTAKSLAEEGGKTSAAQCFYPSPVVFQDGVDPEIPPYSLGMLLANGYLSVGNNVTLSSNLKLGKAIVRRMEREGVKFTELGVVYDSSQGCLTSRLSQDQPIIRQLKATGLLGAKAHDKFLPPEALTASVEYRTRLLAGLIEGDGSLISPMDTRWDYSTVSNRLAVDIQFLVHSLGGRATVTSRITKCEGKPFPSFRMYISLPYKLEMANTQKEGGGSKARYKGLAHPMRTPVEAKIRRVKTKVYGFTLDSSSQWYVTDNWVVTHNSGKTTASLYIAAQVQKAGGVVAFVDAEHSFTKAYAEALGVNCNDLLLSQPFTGEDAFEIMARLVSTGIVDLIIVDSVSALVPKVEREGEISDQGMALQARLLSKGLRVLTSELSKNKTSIIFINQVRETLSSFGYGPKTSSTGGKALKFYASVRLETKKIKTLKDSKDIAYGTVMSVTGVKNKVAAPNRTAELEIHFGKGINVEADLLEVALLDGLVRKEGNTLVYDSGDGKPVKLGLGKEKSVEALKDLPDICKAIRANYSKKAPKKPAKE